MEMVLKLASGTFFFAAAIISLEKSMPVTWNLRFTRALVKGRPGPQPRSNTDACLGSLLQNSVKAALYLGSFMVLEAALLPMAFQAFLLSCRMSI